MFEGYYMSFPLDCFATLAMTTFYFPRPWRESGLLPESGVLLRSKTRRLV